MEASGADSERFQAILNDYWRDKANSEGEETIPHCHIAVEDMD